MSVTEVEQSIAEHGDRYLERIYTERELADCRSAGEVSAERIAARFAAKEATYKALQPAGEAVPWRSIGVRREPAGAVSLELTGGAADVARRAGVTGLALSLSHEADMAAAVVVAELKEEPDADDS